MEFDRSRRPGFAGSRLLVDGIYCFNALSTASITRHLPTWLESSAQPDHIAVRNPIATGCVGEAGPKPARPIPCRLASWSAWHSPASVILARPGKLPVAGLVLKIDTIPKPDGLGQAFEGNTPNNIQTISNGIRDCSAAVRYAFVRDDWKGKICGEQAAIERAALTRSTFSASERTEKAGVGGSIPSLATTFQKT